jgi:mono/diheme cytochrome c family protein
MKQPRPCASRAARRDGPASRASMPSSARRSRSRPPPLGSPVLWAALLGCASLPLLDCSAEPTGGATPTAVRSGGAAGATAGGTGGVGDGTTSSTGASGLGGAGAAAAGDVYRGGLVWNDWTTDIAGGVGLPPGVDEAHRDFVRCVSCHGWDALGIHGGYARRTATAAHPHPTEFTDLSPRFGDVIEPLVEHSWGREWTVFDDRMPAFGQPGGPGAPQITDVVAFLNEGPKIEDVAAVDASLDPVSYSFVGADTAVGQALYGARCAFCHGADGTLEPNARLGLFLTADGAPSEAFHKMVYGRGDDVMTRAAVGELSAAEARDILAYVQAHLGTVFPVD